MHLSGVTCLRQWLTPWLLTCSCLPVNQITFQSLHRSAISLSLITQPLMGICHRPSLHARLQGVGGPEQEERRHHMAEYGTRVRLWPR